MTGTKKLISTTKSGHYLILPVMESDTLADLARAKRLSFEREMQRAKILSSQNPADKLQAIRRYLMDKGLIKPEPSGLI